MEIKLGSQTILKGNGGDDWDDAPYEHNAEEPYDHWRELIEDNEEWTKRKWKRHPISLKALYFELPNYWGYLPCDNFCNSPYSVKDINNHAVAWIHTEDFNIPAGMSMEAFIDVIRNHGGIIYLTEEG